METTVERLDDNKVKLQVTVEADRVEQAVDQAASRLAQEVKVPGFRPGKVPRRVLESRIGRDTLMQEAAREAVPQLYREAVEAEELRVAGQPELDVDTFESGSDAVFSATVEVIPEIEPPQVDDLQLPHPDWELTDEEVQEQLDALRERFATVETVERAADVGDHVRITISAERGGERVEEASGEDLLYRINEPRESEAELDRNLVGAKPGQVASFTDTLDEDFGEELAGLEVDFRVMVKEVKAQRLPELTDEFVDDNTEFETVEALTGELRRQLALQKLQNARGELRGTLVEKVAERVDVTPPEGLVQQELQFRVQRLSQEAEQYGMSPEQYLQALGGQEDVFAKLDEQARHTVKSQLVLDAIGRHAGIEVERADLQTEVMQQAQRLGRDAQQLAEMLNDQQRIGALVSDAFRRKTIDYLMEQVQVVGAPPDDAEQQLVDAGRSEADAEAAAEAAAAEAAASEGEGAGGDEAGEPRGAGEGADAPEDDREG